MSDDESIKEKQRRVKIVSIDQHFLVDVLNWWRNPPHFLALPVTDELPEDCEVLSVSVAWDRRCIEAMVYSKEFPVCDEACIPERVPGLLTEVRRIAFSEPYERVK